MKESLKPGIRYEHHYVVPKNKTVNNVFPEEKEFIVMPEVFATANLVGYLEWACVIAVNPYLDWPHELTVGTHINVSHQAATPPGAHVRAVVELIAVEGRRLTFNVEAYDGMDLISKGQHQRHVIIKENFVAKVNAKAVALAALTNQPISE
jgi:fluoroacetyl-CoA thioesterase